MCIICIFYLFCILCNFFWIIKIVKIFMLFWSTSTISNIFFFKFLPVFKLIFSFQDILAILNTGESSYVKLGYLEISTFSNLFSSPEQIPVHFNRFDSFFLEIWSVKNFSIHDCVLPYYVCTWCNQCIWYLFSLDVSWHYWIYTW